MKQFIVDRHTTPNTPTLEQVPTDKIPLYPTEQDLLDDLANLEVGQIAGTIDPAESELIGVLIQKIQALENGEKYSYEEVKTNKKWWNGSAWVDVYRKVIPVGVTINNSWTTTTIPNPYYSSYTGEIKRVISCVNTDGAPSCTQIDFQSSNEYIRIAHQSGVATGTLSDVQLVFEYIKD